MNYEARKEGSLTIVTITGNMVGGPVCEEFRQYITNLVEEGARRTIFDLTRVPYVASAGAGMIMAARTSLLNRDGELRLVVATERVKHVFNLIQLYRIMRIYETLPEAIESFAMTSEPAKKPADAARAES